MSTETATGRKRAAKDALVRCAKCEQDLPREQYTEYMLKRAAIRKCITCNPPSARHDRTPNPSKSYVCTTCNETKPFAAFCLMKGRVHCMCRKCSNAQNHRRYRERVGKDYGRQGVKADMQYDILFARDVLGLPMEKVFEWVGSGYRSAREGEGIDPATLEAYGLHVDPNLTWQPDELIDEEIDACI